MVGSRFGLELGMLSRLGFIDTVYLWHILLAILYTNLSIDRTLYISIIIYLHLFHFMILYLATLPSLFLDLVVQSLLLS